MRGGAAPGAPKVPGNAHLQEELVKNEGLGLKVEAKGVLRVPPLASRFSSTSPRTSHF